MISHRNRWTGFCESPVSASSGRKINNTNSVWDDNHAVHYGWRENGLEELDDGGIEELDDGGIEELDNVGIGEVDDGGIEEVADGGIDEFGRLAGGLSDGR